MVVGESCTVELQCAVVAKGKQFVNKVADFWILLERFVVLKMGDTSKFNICQIFVFSGLNY